MLLWHWVILIDTYFFICDGEKAEAVVADVRRASDCEGLLLSGFRDQETVRILPGR